MTRHPHLPATRRAIAALALAACAAVSAVPAAAAPAPELPRLESQLLARPADGDLATRLANAYRSSGEVERGIRFFERFHAANPPSPMSLVWQGSLKAMLSASGDDMEARLNWLQSGIADMDRAVRTFPDRMDVRAVRGITVSNFPAFLAMHGKAIRDLEAALAAGDALTPGFRQAARDGLARAYRQAGREADAKRVAESGR